MYHNIKEYIHIVYSLLEWVDMYQNVMDDHHQNHDIYFHAKLQVNTSKNLIYDKFCCFITINWYYQLLTDQVSSAFLPRLLYIYRASQKKGFAFRK